MKPGGLLVLLLALAACARSGADGGEQRGAGLACSDAVYRSIDARVGSGDGRGHGPDVGSDEWKSTIEFRLGLRSSGRVPPRDSDAWCDFIDRYVRDHGGARQAASSNPPDAGPSFACDAVEAGGIEALVCADSDLAALDRELALVYRRALDIAVNEYPPLLRAEQRGWIKGRDECWKSDDSKSCVAREYRLRIAELQARYRLVAGSGPIFYACDGNRSNEVVVTFFDTEPPTLIAERGDSVSLMYARPSDSGAKYRGRNETFWEHHGEATITWGYDAPEMHCKPVP